MISLKKIFLLALCFFLGLVFYATNKAQQKLPDLLRSSLEDSNLEKEGVELEFKKASFTLVSSLSHPFGLRVKELSVKYKKGCQMHLIDVGTLVLPLKILPLYKIKKIDLGLIRFSDASVQNQYDCGDASNQEQAYSGENNAKGVRVRAEVKILSFLKKLKKINTKFLSKKVKNLDYRGALLYNFKVDISKKDKFVLKRFKILKGSGKLKYKADLDGHILAGETESSVKGEITGYQKSLEASFFLKEKEGLLRLDLISNSDEGTPDKIKLSLKSVPLSSLSKIKKSDFAGLNLRKTWLDSTLDIEALKNKITLQVKKFKVYGDFGLVEMDSNTPSLKWAEGGWNLLEPTQLRLQDVDFFEILAKRPRRKIAEVFKDGGQFNAFIKIESLEKFRGDFQTNDFSVSVRSRGSKAYQKIKFARGSLSYQKKKDLTFNLEDVGLENGDFEGYIKFSYDYVKKEIKTKFEVRHLQFDPVITDLLNLKGEQNFSIEGDGYIAKKNLTTKNNNYQSDLRFKLNAEAIVTQHWSSRGVTSLCQLKRKALRCDLAIEEFFVSPKLRQKLVLQGQAFKNLKTPSLEFENKLLTADFKNEKQRFRLEWSSKKGVGISTPRSSKVFVRDL